MDPWVEVKVKGLEIDEKTNGKRETSVIDDNGFHPVWTQKNKFQFQLACPELAQLVFKIYDKDVIGSKKIGWYAIDVDDLVAGYRAVPILNSAF